MGTVLCFLLCSFIVVIARDEVKFEGDMPILKVKVNYPATLECCYSTNLSLELAWFKLLYPKDKDLDQDLLIDRQKKLKGKKEKGNGKSCGTLSFMSAQLNDSGLYKCLLNKSEIKFVSHGTYLLVYKPLEKILNLNENTKNKILTAEGILLFLCVLLPATTILLQSKKLNQLEKKKMKKEEENIYQGLNLDDCWTTYDKIERSQTHGPYQDVCNIMEEEEIQLEKP